jgi:Lytic polysaccharide mono-oxygenase, cellulose-degrading
MLWWLSSAFAHESLEEPIARYETDGFSANKSCPCGQGTNDQYCSDPTQLSDPFRSVDRITTYDAGQTITVKLHEVVGHSGRWRIAFDPDGADLADFNANILLDEPDPPGADGNVGQGDLWEFTVTLPDVPCDNCTLQVLQVMNGDTVNPVPDPTGESSYHQCADLVLLGPVDTGSTSTGTDTATGPTDTATTTVGDTAGDTGATTPGTTDPTPPGPETGDTAGGSYGYKDTGYVYQESCGSGCATSAAGAPWIGWLMLGWLRFRRSR